jgi:hypothetical protein
MDKVVEKKKKERFETVPTHLPGVQLRKEPGVLLDILRKTVTTFYQVAKEFAKTHWQIRDLTGQQDLLREKIIDLVKGNEGLRGIISEEDNFVLTISPREKVSWDQKLLKKSLGIVYSAITREELVVNISIPVGFVTPKVTISEKLLSDVLSKALIENLGISQQDLKKIMRQEVVLSLDEKKLTEMINQGQVKLLPGTQTIEIIWSVRVDRLREGE